jgi:hypothetical protein
VAGLVEALGHADAADCGLKRARNPEPRSRVER